jgi:hypothetical protein
MTLRALVLVAACTSGCMLSPLPDARTPADRAREMQPKCRQETDASAAAVLAPGAIESVEPDYERVPSSSGYDKRMLGARLAVRPLPGLTRESLARALQCHQVRVVTGEGRALVDDPYVLADDWLTIDVDSTGDGFAVTVYPVDYKGAMTVLARARQYAASRPPAAAAAVVAP